jgi:hypothetical protein
MTVKNTRTRKTAETPKAAKASKARTPRKTIAANASNSSRVASKDLAMAAIEAAAAAVALRAPQAEAASAPAPAATPVPAPAPVEAAPAPVAAQVQSAMQAVREPFAVVKASTETLRLAVAESAAASSRGVIEVNDKLIEAMRAQSDAAFDLWRSALSATSVPEAIRIQTGGARQVYETAATQWKDIAETTGRWLAASMQPMQSVFRTPAR